MGAVNVTPDSFYDGGRYLGAEAAARHVDELIEQGADIVDIGGESTRPGAEPVAADEQIARIEPVVRHAVGRGALVSIDTTEPEVAQRMLELGAHIINDTSCLADDGLAHVAAQHGAALVIMHSRGPMKRMPGFSQYPDNAYADVVREVLEEWSAARDRAVVAGMPASDILLDPGLGFAKNARHSYEILIRLAELGAAGARIVVGPSRKSFIASADPAPPAARLGGTIAACLLAVQRGASILRVHDVHDVRQALCVARAAQMAPAERQTEVRHA